MSIVKLNFFSKALNMRTEVTVALPEYPAHREGGRNYKEKFPSDYKFPVVYFLNGFTGDYTDALTMMPLERYAQETGIAVVMPSGLNLWYENILGGPHMKTFIAEELPAAMEAMLPLADTADKRFLAGLSMGGRGTAVISAQYPDRYRASVCLSAPLRLSELTRSAEDQNQELLEQSLNRVFGGSQNLDTKEFDYYAITEALLETGQMIPEMFYLFGEEDPLFKSQYGIFTDFAEKFHLPVIYEAWKNKKHDFEFWDPAMRKAMAWLASKLS